MGVRILMMYDFSAGSNLAEVMVFPQIDHTSTTSNDVVEMGLVLGIEGSIYICTYILYKLHEHSFLYLGARASLFNELRAVLSFDGTYFNQHIIYIYTYT